jgi:GxxExxY protein
MPEPTAELDAIAREVVDSAFMLHSTLGPGLLESVYNDFLSFEIESRGLPIERELALPVFYRGQRRDVGFRMDIVVAKSVVVEIKAVEKLLPVHSAQLLTYLKLSHHHLGLLINFNVPLIKHGIRRLISTR